MDDYGPATYGQRWADIYDEWTARRLGEEDTQLAVDALAELAGGGAVLELGIGTGRLALPLASRGLAVHGIDASEEMVTKLRQKPGGEAVPVTIGDFADVEVSGRFDLVFVAFNTFFALTTQESQVRCFRNVAAKLNPGGLFVVAGFVSDLTRFQGNQTLRVIKISTDELVLDASQHDPIAQTIDAQEVAVTDKGIKLRPIHLRYAWPSELDVMAHAAGLSRRERWSGWDRSPFTAASTAHVTVYLHLG